MRIAFLGTPEVAVPALTALLDADGIEVAVVVTNPDRPKGRSRRPVPPPVKVAAEAAGIEVWQPVRPTEIRDELAALDLDACAVVAYGALLPTSVLETGGNGFVNLHFSLLPRWRGAAPAQHALRAGDTVTGVTTFVLDEGMDTGPVLRQVETEIGPDESAGELLERLAVLGAPVLVDALRDLVDGVQSTEQSTDGVTLAPKIHPDDVAIDWAATSQQVANLIRSANPAPGAHTTVDGIRTKIWRAMPLLDEELTPLPEDQSPGAVLSSGRAGFVVACGHGAVRLVEVQPAGKAKMDAVSFANGARLEVGARLGGHPSPAA